MKIQALALALSAFALLSTTAANAQATRYAYGVGGGALGYPGIIENSAVIGGTCGVPACGSACAPLFGRHTFYDNGMAYRSGGMFGGLLGFGLGRPGYGFGGPAVPYGPAGINSYAAVIPGTCGAAAVAPAVPPVCGQRLANSWLDLRLFRFGFGFGRVNPHWDMRPAGWAI